MAATNNIEPIYYTSRYDYGLDEKRRLQIPAKWRSADQGTQYAMVLWPKAALRDACLLVLPPEEWAALVQKVKAMPFADAKAEALRRALGEKSDRVSMDKSGRICIAEWMTKAAGIEREVALVGLLDRFEIWNPERYEAAKAEDKVLVPDAFQMI